MRRQLLIIVLGLALACTGTAKATEGDPVSNDSVESALAIAALPFDHEARTDSASTGPEDSVSVCSPEAGYSVWYEYTPAEDEPLSIDIDATFYPVIEVFEGSELAFVDCAFGQFSSQAQLIVDVIAGTRYFIRLASPYNRPGYYALHVERYVPFTVDVQFEERSRLTPGGRAEVPGTVTCSEPTYVTLAVDGRQGLGPVAITGYGEAGFTCNGVHSVLVRVDPRDAAFIPGRLDLEWEVYACADDDRIELRCVTPAGVHESLLLPL